MIFTSYPVGLWSILLLTLFVQYSTEQRRETKTDEERTSKCLSCQTLLFLFLWKWGLGLSPGPRHSCRIQQGKEEVKFTPDYQDTLPLPFFALCPPLWLWNINWLQVCIQISVNIIMAATPALYTQVLKTLPMTAVLATRTQSQSFNQMH